MFRQELFITDFGAVGDGITDDTAAIQKAIDACAEGPYERVVVPKGRFVVGTLHLRSFVELHLCGGSELYASPDYAAYPPIRSEAWNTDFAPRKNSRCLIYGENLQGFSITGHGTIQCHGIDWCEEDPCKGRINEYRRRTDEVIPRVLMLVGCENFALTDFCIQDSPAGWATWLICCRQGKIDGMRIFSDRRMPNADGLHINCCQDLTVSHCHFNTGDDALILRAYTSMLAQPVPCERITVTNCLLSSHSCAVRIGWCNDYVIRDCLISDCVISDSVLGLVVQLPAFPERVADQGTDETVVERISFHNILMKQIFFEPIHLSALPGSGVDQIADLHFSHIQSESRLPIRINGTAERPIKDIHIDHSTFRLIDTLNTPYPIPQGYWNQSAYDGMPPLCHAHGLRLENTSLDF